MTFIAYWVEWYEALLSVFFGWAFHGDAIFAFNVGRI